jgi:hypothetical protein
VRCSDAEIGKLLAAGLLAHTNYLGVLVGAWAKNGLYVRLVQS